MGNSVQVVLLVLSDEVVDFVPRVRSELHLGPALGYGQGKDFGAFAEGNVPRFGETFEDLVGGDAERDVTCSMLVRICAFGRGARRRRRREVGRDILCAAEDDCPCVLVFLDCM